MYQKSEGQFFEQLSIDDKSEVGFEKQSKAPSGRWVEIENGSRCIIYIFNFSSVNWGWFWNLTSFI